MTSKNVETKITDVLADIEAYSRSDYRPEIHQRQREFESLLADNAKMKKEMEEIKMLLRDRCLLAEESGTDLPPAISSLGEESSLLGASQRPSPGPERQSLVKSLTCHLRDVGKNGHGDVNLNTGTVNMFAVAAAVDPSYGFKAWLIALGTLVLVCLQSFVFSAVVFESSYPRCSSVGDCPAGNFCDINGTFVCRDCFDLNLFFEDSVKKTFLPDSAHMLLLNSTDFLADTSTCPSQSSHGWEDYHGLGYDEKRCAAYHHCKNTDMDVSTNFMGHCDFVHLNMKKMDLEIWTIIFFLSLLWMLPVCQDVAEATAEEIVLDYHLKGTLNGPAEIIRVSLRIRKYWLPFFATSATVVLLLTGEMSSINVILNFLAVTMVLETDNAIALLFLNGRRTAIMEAVAEDVDGKAIVSAQKAFFWTRAQGFLVTLILLATIIYFHEVEVQDCTLLFKYLLFIVYVPALLLLGAMPFYRIIWMKRATESIGERVLKTLISFCRNLFAVFVVSNLFYILTSLRTHGNLIFQYVVHLPLPIVNKHIVRNCAALDTAIIMVFVGLLVLKHKCYGTATRGRHSWR